MLLAFRSVINEAVCSIANFQTICGFQGVSSQFHQHVSTLMYIFVASVCFASLPVLALPFEVQGLV